jgi:hypothetical protein
MNVLEDDCLHIHRRENLKSHMNIQHYNVFTKAVLNQTSNWLLVG